MTFDSASTTSDPSNPNAKYKMFYLTILETCYFSLFVCPSSCYTEEYRSNQQEYPLFGNFSYSGVSLDVKFSDKKKLFFRKF